MDNQQTQQQQQDNNNQQAAEQRLLTSEFEYYNQDVRIKRHPELQPYVPSDRFRLATASNYSSSSNNSTRNNQQTSSTRSAGKKGASSSSNSSLASGQPRKYVSMTRLNQLAQPKRRQDGKSVQDQHKQQQQEQQQQLYQQQQRQLQQQQLLKQKQQQQQKQKQLQQELKYKQERRKSQPATTPKVNTLKATTMMTSSSPIDPTETLQSSTPRDKRATPAVEHALMPATPSASESIDKSQNDRSLNGGSGNQTMDRYRREDDHHHDDNAEQDNDDDIEKCANQSSGGHMNGEYRQLAADSTFNKRSFNESSLAEQISEVSVNDPFYESAASELAPDSETSTNGINFTLNPESLMREIHRDFQELKGDGGSRSTNLAGVYESPKLSDNLQDFERRTSAATIVPRSPSHKQYDDAVLSESSKRDDEQEEDDRRLKIERELREKARLAEEERKERGQIVDNILSRFSQGSVS